jgi:hypothetical protein
LRFHWRGERRRPRIEHRFATRLWTIKTAELEFEPGHLDWARRRLAVHANNETIGRSSAGANPSAYTTAAREVDVGS